MIIVRDHCNSTEAGGPKVIWGGVCACFPSNALDIPNRPFSCYRLGLGWGGIERGSDGETLRIGIPVFLGVSPLE